MSRLRAGIVGCGKVTDLHAQALAALETTELAALCSRSPEKASEWASRYGLKGHADVAEMVTSEKLDVVIVCTPHPAHAEPAIAAMQTGANVLVEKPLAASLEDCDAMIAAAKTNGVVLGTVSQRRFYPPCQRIRRAIDDGKIGRPVLGVVNMFGWRDRDYYESDAWRGTWDGEGGGVLVNQAPHQLDLLLWYMGEPEALSGYWGNLNHPYIDVEDTAVAAIRFRDGGLGNIVVSNSQNPALYGRVGVFGSNGASVGVQTDGGAMFIAGMSNIEEPPLNDTWTVPGEEKLLEQWRQEDTALFERIDAMSHYHRLQVADFIEAVLEDRPPLVTAEDGRRTVELFTAIYRSQEEGRPVKLGTG